jgi:8-oxo-dGTP pyrophosphatase MutT (NUDIX family)
VLVRDAGDGPEALLLRRPHGSSFAASAWVFPGGIVDPEDAAVGRTMLGDSPDEWARRLEIPAADAVAFVAAALREAWEETGILLSDPAPDPDAVRAARERLLAGDLTLDAALREGDLRLDARGVVYIAHWITPEPETRRYDTRFFLAVVPPGTTCDLLGDELTEARWVRPAAAVDHHAAGELRLLPPTVHTLHRLAAFRTVREMVGALREMPVRAILPTMRRDGRGVVIQIPQE